MRLQWRYFVIALLVLAPIGFLVGVGVYHLWTTGWTFTAWWPMALSLASAYALAWYWTRRNSRAVLPDPGLEAVPNHWTDRDRKAWKLVEDYVGKVESVDIERAGEPNLYLNQARELADIVGKVYYPDCDEAYSRLTIPEILTCVELATRDMARRTDEYIPGSHYWTIADFRRARKAIDWYEKARNTYWLVSGLINPLKAGSQYAASRLGFAKPLNKLRDNALNWFHQAFLFEAGRHSIELFSGRLKTGAVRFQAALAGAAEPSVPAAAAAPAGLRIVVVGEAGSGKSSLVQSIIRASGASTYTAEVAEKETRFRLVLPSLAACTIVDCVGYAASGKEDLRGPLEHTDQADLIILATAAARSERANDLSLMEKMKALFAERPELRKPPVIVALTRMGEGDDAEARVRDAKALFGDSIVAVVPLSTVADSPFAAGEALLPVLADWADAAKGGAALKRIHSDRGRRGIRAVARQTAQSVGATVRAALWRRPAIPPPSPKGRGE